MDLPKEEYRSIEGEKIGVNTRLKIVKIHPRRRTSTTQREEERERESSGSSWHGGWRMQVTAGNCYHYLACSLPRRWRLLVGGAPFGPTMRETWLAIPSTLVSIDDRHFVESANSISLEHAWHFIANRTACGRETFLLDLRPSFFSKEDALQILLNEES